MFRRRKKKAIKVQPIYKVVIIGSDEDTELLILYNYISNFLNLEDTDISEDLDQQATLLDTPIVGKSTKDVFDIPGKIRNNNSPKPEKNEEKGRQSFKEKEFKDHIGKMQGFNPFKINDEKVLRTEIEKHGTPQVKKIINEPSPVGTGKKEEVSEEVEGETRKRHRRRRSKSDMKPQSPMVVSSSPLTIKTTNEKKDERSVPFRRMRQSRSKTVLSPMKKNLKTIFTRPQLDRASTVSRYDLPKSSRRISTIETNTKSTIRRREKSRKKKRSRSIKKNGELQIIKSNVFKRIRHDRNFSLDFEEQRLMLDFSNLEQNERMETHEIISRYYNFLLSNMKTLSKKYELVKMQNTSIDAVDDFIEQNLLELSLQMRQPDLGNIGSDPKNEKAAEEDDEEEEEGEEEEVEDSEEDTEESEESEVSEEDDDESNEDDEEEERNTTTEGQGEEDEEEEGENEEEESEVESSSDFTDDTGVFGSPRTLPSRPPNFLEVVEGMREDLGQLKRKMGKMKEEWISLRKERIELEKLQELKRAEIQDISSSHEKCLLLLRPRSLPFPETDDRENIFESDQQIMYPSEAYLYRFPFANFKLKFMKRFRRGIEIFNMDLKPGFKKILNLFTVSFSRLGNTNKVSLCKLFYKIMNFNRMNLCEFLTMEKNDELLRMFIRVYFESVTLQSSLPQQQQHQEDSNNNTESGSSTDNSDGGNNRTQKRIPETYFEYFVDFFKYFTCPAEGQKIGQLVNVFSDVYYQQKILGDERLRKNFFKTVIKSSHPQNPKNIKRMKKRKKSINKRRKKVEQQQQQEEEEEEEGEEHVNSISDDFATLGLSVMWLNPILHNPKNKKVQAMIANPWEVFLEQNGGVFRVSYLQRIFEMVKKKNCLCLDATVHLYQRFKAMAEEKKKQNIMASTASSLSSIASYHRPLILLHKHNYFELVFASAASAAAYSSHTSSIPNNNNSADPSKNSGGGNNSSRVKSSKGEFGEIIDQMRLRNRDTFENSEYFDLFRNAHFFILVWKDTEDMKPFKTFIRIMKKFDNTRDKIIILDCSSARISHNIFPFPIFSFSDLNGNGLMSQIFDYILKPRITEISSMDYYTDHHRNEKSLKKMQFSQLVTIPKMYI